MLNCRRIVNQLERKTLNQKQIVYQLERKTLNYRQIVNKMERKTLNQRKIVYLLIPITAVDYLPSSMQIGSGSHIGAIALHRPVLRQVLIAG